MSDSVLEKYTKQAKAEVVGLAADTEEVDDVGAFGWLRGVRDRAIMLELRLKDGTVSTYGYAWLKKAKLDPSGEITLDFSGEPVRIFGRNLNAEVRPNVRLFDGIVRHKVPWLVECDIEGLFIAGKEATIIEEVKEK